MYSTFLKEFSQQKYERNIYLFKYIYIYRLKVHKILIPKASHITSAFSRIHSGKSFFNYLSAFKERENATKFKKLTNRILS